MKACWYERNGPADEVLVVGDMADPAPGVGEVVVRMKSSAVNPSDVKSRMGLRAKMTLKRQVPHSDGAGEIVAVGSGVPAARLGERVWVFNAAYLRAGGTAAELCALPAEFAVPLPQGLDDAQGACLGIPVMTAHRCLFADGSPTGQTVLVSGGAGVVGHYAVQLARWAGAEVIATVSGEAKATHAKAAGAHHVINYRGENVAERVKEITGGRGLTASSRSTGREPAAGSGDAEARGRAGLYGSKSPTAEAALLCLDREERRAAAGASTRSPAAARSASATSRAGSPRPRAVQHRRTGEPGEDRRGPSHRRGRQQDRPRRGGYPLGFSTAWLKTKKGRGSETPA